MMNRTTRKIQGLALIFYALMAPDLTAATAPFEVLADELAPTDDDAPRKPLSWRLGAEGSVATVPLTNSFLKGDNAEMTPIRHSGSLSLRTDFSFTPTSRIGRLYPGLYQGLGSGVHTFSGKDLLGTPVSLYLYQGAPFARLGNKLTLGYEWQFGVAFAWHHYADSNAGYNLAVSTRLTAHMALALKLAYRLTPSLELTLSPMATHFSNGNTSYPNGGINCIGLAMGLSYRFDRPTAQQPQANHSAAGDAEKASAHRWLTDIVAYGAWRKRPIVVNDDAQIIPGRFGVAGVQVAELRQLNRWFAAGAALTLQYDESASLTDHWIDGTWGDDIKFTRPRFGNQLSLGFSLHGELTAYIFTVNAGVGVEAIRPNGDNRFFQSLTLKTFLTPHLFLNAGYRLGDFHNPQNLMLGIGVRL